MSNKTYGLNKERELRKIFEKKGFWVVPAKGSLGVFDGIAFNKKRVILFQCKATKQKYYSYKKDIERMKKFKNYPPTWRKELWIYLGKIKGRKAKWIKKEVN